MPHRRCVSNDIWTTLIWHTAQQRPEIIAKSCIRCHTNWFVWTHGPDRCDVKCSVWATVCPTTSEWPMSLRPMNSIHPHRLHPCVPSIHSIYLRAYSHRLQEMSIPSPHPVFWMCNLRDNKKIVCILCMSNSFAIQLTNHRYHPDDHVCVQANPQNAHDERERIQTTKCFRIRYRQC